MKSYCGNASIAGIPCKDGTVGNRTGIRSQDECESCPAGYWCNSGEAFPCAKNYYTISNSPSNESQTLDACLLCPLHSVTSGQASANISSCGCQIQYYLNNPSKDADPSNVTCKSCPTGAACSLPGVTLESLAVENTYWKPGFLSVDVKQCPYLSTCANGSTPNTRYDNTSDATCTPGLGVTGVYCMLCSDLHHYFDEGAQRCNACGAEAVWVVVFITCFVLLVYAIVIIARYNVLPKIGLRWVQDTMRDTTSKYSLITKIKICVSYYQIITQIDRVYAIIFPPAYARVVAALNSIFHIFFGWIPGVTTKCTGLRLSHELLLITFLPMAFIFINPLMALIYSRQSPTEVLTKALPFTLVTTFVCFPFIASRGFRALAPCDCFKYVDGHPDVCFIHGAYSIECEVSASGHARAPTDIRAAAWLAIVVYACIVPALYAMLLFWERRALRGSATSTPLSHALAFLTKDYRHGAFFWELVEVTRKITITGFLALVEPGSLLQLYLGVVVAMCILILQLYASPYKSPGDSFLSALSASALVLSLLATLGIQLVRLVPELSTYGLELTGLNSNSLLIIVVVLIGSALLVLAAAVVMLLFGAVIVRLEGRARRLRIVNTDEDVLLGALPNLQKCWPELFWDPDTVTTMPRAGPFHTFLSHNWKHGQSEMRIVKTRLREMVPDVEVFLDVDNLGGGSDHPHIDVSDTLVCYLTQGWFTSPPCVREFLRAVLRKKPLIALLEPDTSDQHGGHHEAECRRILMSAEYAQWMEESMGASVAQWAQEWRPNMRPSGLRWQKTTPFVGMGLSSEALATALATLGDKVEFTQEEWDAFGITTLRDDHFVVSGGIYYRPSLLPTGRELVDALFERPAIVWYRLADFQDVSMRLIAERLLLHCAAAKRARKSNQERKSADDLVQRLRGSSVVEERMSSSAKEPATKEPATKEPAHARTERTYYMQGEIVQQLKRSPVKLRAREDCEFHVFCSPSSPGNAVQMVQELTDMFLPTLTWTDDPARLADCEHMLVVLTDDMWTRGVASSAFAHELCDAMRTGVHRLLVHEVPGARLGDNEGRHACTFDQIIGNMLTIDAAGFKFKYLMDDGGLYNEIAMNVGSDEWREVGLAKIASQLATGSGTRDKWICEINEPGGHADDLGLARRAVLPGRRSKAAAAGGFRSRLGLSAWRLKDSLIKSRAQVQVEAEARERRHRHERSESSVFEARLSDLPTESAKTASFKEDPENNLLAPGANRSHKASV